MKKTPEGVFFFCHHVRIVFSQRGGHLSVDLISDAEAEQSQT